MKKDERGYPIPYFVKWYNGKPDFRVADGAKQFVCAKRRVCWVCGSKLDHHVAFIGGPISCTQSYAFSDGPMHRECAEYALIVCPYLAIPASKYRDANLPDCVELPPGALEEKPERFGLLVTTSYVAAHHGDGLVFVANSFTELTWWKEGKKL